MLSTTAQAEPPSAHGVTRQVDPQELSARLRVLLTDARDPAVKQPAEQAKLALERAADPALDDASRARSLELAQAALALAEARLQLAAERSLTARATARRDAALARLARARAGGTSP
ncbi:MAG TPA: hypothetical protein VFZ61_14400 [Polyangiales bacterium]